MHLSPVLMFLEEKRGMDFLGHMNFAREFVVFLSHQA